MARVGAGQPACRQFEDAQPHRNEHHHFIVLEQLGIDGGQNLAGGAAHSGTVIDGVAKDLSEFSYVYSLTGLAEKQSKLNADGAQAYQSIDNVVDNLDDVTGTLGNLKDLGSSLINDSEMQSSMLALLENEAANKIESMATALVVKQFAKGRLSGTTSDCETVLKRLGVEKTSGTYLGSIDFGDSVFCVNGSAEIKVVARYSVKLIKLLNVDITFDICQCASTKAWGAAAKTDDEVAGDSDNTDETSPTEENTQDTTAETTVPETTQKSLDDIAREYTHNSSSNKVMIGSGNALISDAESIGATYFVMGNDYNGNYDERTIRKKFLDQNVGKQFYINTDPDKTTDTNVKQAVLWLQGQGYTFKKNALGYWEAVKEY